MTKEKKAESKSEQIKAKAQEIKREMGLREIFVVSVFLHGEETDENERILILKKPSRLQKKAALKVYQKDSNKAIETFARSMYLEGGDDLEEVLDNDDAFASLEDAIAEIIAPKAANLMKV